MDLNRLVFLLEIPLIPSFLVATNHFFAKFNFLMSRHPSFKPPGGLAVRRNVLKRFERVELLRKRGQWKEGDRVVSLLKTKPEE